MAADNKLLGNFELVGIPSAPRGVPQIEVTFDIDANGIVSVSAKDKGTGKEQKIQIQASGGLSDEEINKMVKDAEANKEVDKKKRETVDARNQADTIIHTTEKNLKEHGSKISDADKKAIETGISDLRNALKGTDTEEVKKNFIVNIVRVDKLQIRFIQIMIWLKSFRKNIRAKNCLPKKIKVLSEPGQLLR